MNSEMSYIIFSTLQEKKKHKMNNIFFCKRKQKGIKVEKKKMDNIFFIKERQNE
jgi:hypothetical protein